MNDATDHATASRDTSVDPVCGMQIDPSTELTVEHDGQTYRFCSQHCRTRFQASPATYTSRHGGHLAGQSGTPTHGTGARPGQPLHGADAQWTCPMHPQIRRPGPGSCPICGMALEPVTVSVDTGPSHELVDMTRRFWIGAALSVPIVLLEMGGHFIDWVHRLVPPTVSVCGRNSSWPHPSCSGQDGRSSSAAGPHCAAAT